MEQLGVSLGYLVSQLVNFGILLALLYWLLYKPVLNILHKRQERIAQSMRDVDLARENAARAQEDYDRRIAEAQRKAQEIIGQASQASEKVAADIRAEAQREAEAIRQRAREEAAEERARLLSDVQAQIANLSLLAAERVLGQGMDDKLQRRLIDQSLADLGTLQRQGGARTGPNGGQSR